MKNRKWFIGLICILILVIAIGGAAAGQSREKADINIIKMNQGENKDNAYFQYISRKVASEINENYEFTNTEIDVTHTKEEVTSVDVHISGEDIETAEAEIASYVSQCFDVPKKYVNIYYD
jgi:hypothetical protein